MSSEGKESNWRTYLNHSAFGCYNKLFRRFLHPPLCYITKKHKRNTSAKSATPMQIATKPTKLERSNLKITDDPRGLLEVELKPSQPIRRLKTLSEYLWKSLKLFQTEKNIIRIFKPSRDFRRVPKKASENGRRPPKNCRRLFNIIASFPNSLDN